MIRNETTAFRNAPKLCSAVEKSWESVSGSRPVSHAVNVDTTEANASAMIRPVAISIRLPFRMNALKPLMDVSPLGQAPERGALVSERQPR